MTSPQPQGRPRGPYARTAQRRRDVARAVLDLVREQGHASVTTAEVARRSATAEATVMYHFPTKAHLLVAALQLSDDEAQRRFDEGPFDLEKLRAYAHTAPDRANVMRLYAALAGDATVPGHPAHEYFAEHYRSGVRHFAALIAERQRTGLAHPGLEPADVARQFVAVWDGLQAQWLISGDFDLGESLVAAFRRLTAQNWMDARRLLLEDDAGL